MKIIYIRKNPAYFNKLKVLEVKSGKLLDLADPQFPMSETILIFEPGIHIGIEEVENAVVFVVKIKFDKLLTYITVRLVGYGFQLFKSENRKYLI
jgi:hypothetical protein